ncbi:ComF family protein [Candidatus Saccharibacteria bacterium]|nr:ComF family protein [Candidatus Saccharibacteria bacterium]
MSGFFMCGKRKGLLKELINEYKYGPVRGMALPLAEILDELLPEMENVVVVPLPTIPKHVRVRGFDHMVLLARKIAKIRGWECRKLLSRKNNTVQVGADAKKRFEQAESAYDLRGKVDIDKVYLLLDDVLTTGASMTAAERVLKNAGARKIYKAVVAKS